MAASGHPPGSTEPPGRETGPLTLASVVGRRPAGLALAVVLTLIFLACSLLPRISHNANLRGSLWAAGAGLLVWQLGLLLRSRRTGRRTEVAVVLRPTHYVQAALQLAIFLYWGWHWRNVYDHAELLLAQLLFAYVFDMLLCWSRRERWQLGFGQLPIVFSTNLFLWFKDDWFLLQFLMLAAGALGKELFTWTRDGRRTHVFNPSGLSLSLFSVALIATRATGISWGEEIAFTLRYPDHIYLEIFLLGLVVQYLFSVTLVTLSAAAMLCLLSAIYTAGTGVYFFVDTSIPIAVFLGLHLLVTDPATSPRTASGRIAFGALYGVSVFALYGLLGWLGAPTFYDKLLCVPLLNLSVRALDRFASGSTVSALEARARAWLRGSNGLNLASMALWTVLFVSMVTGGLVGDGHRGRSPVFWEDACDRGLRRGCESLVEVQIHYCRAGSSWACNEAGVLLSEDEVVPRDPVRAARSFVRGCELGLPVACTNVANLASDRPVQSYEPSVEEFSGLLDPSPEGEAERARAAEEFRRGCDAGDARACYHLAFALATGRGVPQDKARAVELLQEACRLGLPGVCPPSGGLEQ